MRPQQGVWSLLGCGWKAPCRDRIPISWDQSGIWGLQVLTSLGWIYGSGIVSPVAVELSIVSLPPGWKIVVSGSRILAKTQVKERDVISLLMDLYFSLVSGSRILAQTQVKEREVISLLMDL